MGGIFHSMATTPWPYLILLPAVWMALTAVGFTRDDYIEEAVANIWIPTEGQYAQDKAYAKSLDKDSLGATTFAAMAVARDGGNLLTSARLGEIQSRMQDTERHAQVEYDGDVYTWQDICLSNDMGLNTAYQFPCTRLSPMDLFQEARWWFDDRQDIDDTDDTEDTSTQEDTQEEDQQQDTFRLTWYNKIFREQVVLPRLRRFSVLQNTCTSLGDADQSVSTACDHVYRLRTDPAYAVEQGYPIEYANPLGLFSDIGNLEYNDECKICIETGLEATIARLSSVVMPLFQVLFAELSKLQASGTVPQDNSNDLEELLTQVGTIVQTMDRNAVLDFYTYYVLRGLVGVLGAPAYVTRYPLLLTPTRLAVCQSLNLTCPPPTVTPQEAVQHLLAQADNVFSSVTTAGAPFPVWSEGDGTGFLFGGNQPVGGSGIDMSGTLLSTVGYLDLENYGKPEWDPPFGADGLVDPTSPTWAAIVETDPVYRWFLAGQTPMTSHCGNGVLPGTGIAGVDALIQDALVENTPRWCNKHTTPLDVDGTETQLHFAKMWYDLVTNSDQFLGVQQGVSDPYRWTTGQGCGYTLGGQRDKYTNKTEAEILLGASRELYYIDEGETIGPNDRSLLMGGVIPSIGEYNMNNPLQQVTVMQQIYPALLPKDIVTRVQNCNRPGGPIAKNLTIQDAEEILEKFKEVFEDHWTEGWDKENEGDVQFVGFFDDSGVIGTTGRMLRDITLSNGPLMAVSIIIIAVFSVLFLCSLDAIESRILLTLAGVTLVLLAYFAAIGFAIIIGIKINVTIAWTLPFIILGLGVDDMYIVILALRKQRGHTLEDFIEGMKEVIIPVTMTSLVNACMFAVMNINDVPAVYLTAQVALIAVCFLYVTIIFSFPAYCYLDMRRQAAGRNDVCFWKKREEPVAEGDERTKPYTMCFYDSFYKPLVLSKTKLSVFVHIVIWLLAGGLLGVGIYGITEREVGLGLEDFYPEDHQANRWATIRTEELGSWSIGINWGELDYGNPDTQMKMIKQFEDVVDTDHVTEVNTNRLWMANFLIWTSRHCTENFGRVDFDEYECGENQIFVEQDGTESTCAGTWMPNEYGLRLKNINKDPLVCEPFTGGICRKTEDMHFLDLMAATETDGVESWCPVFSGWSDAKMGFCIQQWRRITGGGGNLILGEGTATANPDCAGEFYDDETVEVPILYSAGPTMFSIDLTSHEVTLEALEETRAICDDHPELHCWMTGIPYDYWSQYEGIFSEILVVIGGVSVAVGFGVSFLFLLSEFGFQSRYGPGKILVGSFVGAAMIGITTLLSLVAVVGLSVLSGVNLTGFSVMSYTLSVGFAVEYSVHIVHRWMEAPKEIESSFDRVEYAMSFLKLPTFMAFVSSTIGVATLAFTEFSFNHTFFFKPLIIVMFVTYFVGAYWLPVCLSILNFDILKFGASTEDDGGNGKGKRSDSEEDEEVDENGLSKAKDVAVGAQAEADVVIGDAGDEPKQAVAKDDDVVDP